MNSKIKTEKHWWKIEHLKLKSKIEKNKLKNFKSNAKKLQSRQMKWN